MDLNWAFRYLLLCISRAGLTNTHRNILMLFWSFFSPGAEAEQHTGILSNPPGFRECTYSNRKCATGSAMTPANQTLSFHPTAKWGAPSAMCGTGSGQTLHCVRANKAPWHSSLGSWPGTGVEGTSTDPSQPQLFWECTPRAEVKHPAFLLAHSQLESHLGQLCTLPDNSARFLLASEKESIMVVFNPWSFAGVEKTGIFWWSLSQQTDFSSYWNKTVKFWPALDL